MQVDGVRTLSLSGGAYVVTCSGAHRPVDEGIAAGLVTTRARDAVFVIVDVREARRIGVVALARLLGESQSLRHAGGDLWLVVTDPRLLRELETDGTGANIHLEATLAGAVEALNDRLVA